jgi:hypothetical protein
MATTAQAAALIDRLMPTVEAGMHAADDLTLAHEAERLEAQQDSPVVHRLRRIVAAEQAGRRAKAVSSHG